MFLVAFFQILNILFNGNFLIRTFQVTTPFIITPINFLNLPDSWILNFRFILSFIFFYVSSSPDRKNCLRELTSLVPTSHRHPLHIKCRSQPCLFSGCICYLNIMLAMPTIRDMYPHYYTSKFLVRYNILP